MPLITDTRALAAFCDRMRQERFVAVDTEFMRDRTYWPRLCLVQVAGEKEAVAIDALAPGIDLAPLLALMADPAVLKVMHAARQDLEIFHRLGQLPHPFFDTQVAAMVCGFGEEVAYETLVNKVAKAQLDKSSRFTDWARRPLTEAQIRYALGDVTHLRVIYESLHARIEKAGRMGWVQEELEALLDPRLYENPPEEAWKRLKLRSRDGRFVAIVQALAAWREREAQRRDLPRARIIRDDLLLEVAANRPQTVEELRSLERVSVDKEGAAAIVAAIREVMALPRAALPQLPEPVVLPRGIGPIVDLLRVLLKYRCEEAEVAQRLVASTADLEAIAVDDRADVPAMHGWRREIFGEDALALKAGRLALAVRGRRPAVIRLEQGTAAS
ncbi:ribonuclease D [Benzoatithermus flavus]|uniref:Ribonuclease D n=1 Tax=Benzoatithermus flavus TaxID=3108223 RepID=A0ABU8XRE2_9PROT